ncbi:hypothetical protein DSM106972_012940 [Dulcicalothrix desertica PCC 7102]|uniref:GDSL family lipase n=2 Tax=Dulcicalothrix desertica TaxID=32056 RepID=A0A3S1ASJ8_9CYAN|nr:hypothetical protein DSM106972_012940 [Dulcicalothrix desertica PCC 7102]
MAADFNFSQFFVFGDSLSDTGNTFTATKGTIPVPTSSLGQPAYFQGRFSNGPIWVDYFGQQIGKTPTPALPLQLNPSLGSQGGVNFALGGAQSGISATFPGFQGDIPGVVGQVGLFSSQPNVPVDSNAIYSIFGGSNDYIAGNTNVSQVVTNLASSIDLLAQKNAKNFLVFNLPDLGDTPFARVRGATGVLNGLAQEHNKELASALDNLRTARPDLNIYSVDINTLFKTVRANPSSFGFENVVDACVTGNFLSVTNVCSNPNDFVFFDDVHPSERAHSLIASAALASIKSGNKSVPEPSVVVGVLTLASLGAVRVLKRKNKKLVLLK